jgi:TonB family protein
VSSECTSTNPLVPFLLLVVFNLATLGVSAQQSINAASGERDRGIQLYTQGDNKGAINTLRAAVKRDKNDGDAWYYLGLALVRLNDMKSARKAFEATVRLKPNLGPARTGLAYTLMAADRNDEAERQASRAIELNSADAQAHYVLGVVQLRSWRNTEAQREAETAIAQRPNFAPAYLLKSQVLLAIEGDESSKASKILRVPGNNSPTAEEREEREQRSRKTAELFAAAADALQTYLKLAESDRETSIWKEQLETLRVFAGSRGQSGAPEVLGSWEVTNKVRILTKPEPGYTEEARMSGLEGMVILRAVFSSNGTVEHILVLRSLPGGLTGQAIQAARKIRFTPATKDGKPVSMILELQYNFSLY